MKNLALILFLLSYSVLAERKPTVEKDSASLWMKITRLENRITADFPKTFATAKSVLKEAEDSNCLGCKGRAQMMLGKFYWVNGEYNKGIALFNQSISIAKGLKDYDTWSKATDLIANTYYYQAYYDSAEHYFQKAFAIAEEVNDIEGMILILHNTSLMYHRKGDFKKTIEYIFKGEKLKDLKPRGEHHMEAFGAMGSLMIDSIYYREEINDELKNLGHYLQKNDSMSVYYTYYNIAKAYRQLLNHKLAARYFIKSCKVMEEMGLIPEWDMVAKDYSDANMKDSAFYYHFLAKKNIFRATAPNVAYTFELMGDTHLHFNQFDSALYYYDQALAMNYAMNNRITFTGIHRQLVRVHTSLGNYDIAESHLNTGLKLAKEVALIHEKNLFNEGKFLFESKGDYKKALYYSEKYKIYLDSVNNQETAINLTRMQVEFETAKKESELVEISQLNLLNEEKIKTRNLQVVMSIISVILLGSFGGLYFSKFREKKKTSDLLSKQKGVIENQYKVVQKQNANNEALLHEIHHRVKNNLQIISSLINIKARSSSDETKEILVELNNRIHSLGLIHEMLYKSDQLGTVNLKNYLTEQSQLTLSSLDNIAGSIQLALDLDDVESNLDSALAMGLISNELITNSIKYAFAPGQQQKLIKVALRKINGKLEYAISDNGEKLSDLEITKSFGLRFVEQLVKSKLNGELVIRQENGLRIEMILQLMK